MPKCDFNKVAKEHLWVAALAFSNFVQPLWAKQTIDRILTVLT